MSKPRIKQEAAPKPKIVDESNKEPVDIVEETTSTLELPKSGDEEEEEGKDENQEEGEEKEAQPAPIFTWDKVSNQLATMGTLMRVRKEWVPPNWDEIMTKIKEEGRDASSIDRDLGEINKDNLEDGKETGKYLMPEDIKWCRLRTKFSERDLFVWFKRFRKQVPKGRIPVKGVFALFNMAFPDTNEEHFTEYVEEIYIERLKVHKHTLDFKDFIKIIDVVNCKSVRDKLSWACGLMVPGSKNQPLLQRHLPILVNAMDLVEFGGFTEQPGEEEMEDLQAKKDKAMLSSTLDNRQRVEEVMEWVQEHEAISYDGKIERECILSMPEPIIYAKF